MPPAALAAILVLIGPIAASAQQPQVPSVIVAPVAERDVSAVLRYVGRVEAIRSVDLRARVDGYLAAVRFSGGETVAVGDPLFEIETAPFEAALEEARARVARARAALDQAARRLARQEELRARGVVADAGLDDALADRDVAAADLAAAQAAVRRAELDLSYSAIAAPIAGRIGRAAVTEGNLVGPSTGPLARLVQTDPIRVVFSVNDRDVTAERRAAGGASLDAIEAQFTPSLVLSDGAPFEGTGRIAFVDNEVDRATGTTAIWAEFDNPDGLLAPGQFVDVEVRREAREPRLVVSAAAVLRDREGPFVLVVEQDVARQRRVLLGPAAGQDFVVLDGLAAGERVVVDGLQRVAPGSQVVALPQEARVR